MDFKDSKTDGICYTQIKNTIRACGYILKKSGTTNFSGCLLIVDDQALPTAEALISGSDNLNADIYIKKHVEIAISNYNLVVCVLDFSAFQLQPQVRTQGPYAAKAPDILGQYLQSQRLFVLIDVFEGEGENKSKERAHEAKAAIESTWMTLRSHMAWYTKNPGDVHNQDKSLPHYVAKETSIPSTATPLVPFEEWIRDVTVRFHAIPEVDKAISTFSEPWRQPEQYMPPNGEIHWGHGCIANEPPYLHLFQATFATGLDGEDAKAIMGMQMHDSRGLRRDRLVRAIQSLGIDIDDVQVDLSKNGRFSLPTKPGLTFLASLRVFMSAITKELPQDSDGTVLERPRLCFRKEGNPPKYVLECKLPEWRRKTGANENEKVEPDGLKNAYEKFLSASAQEQSQDTLRYLFHNLVLAKTDLMQTSGEEEEWASVFSNIERIIEKLEWIDYGFSLKWSTQQDLSRR